MRSMHEVLNIFECVYVFESGVRRLAVPGFLAMSVAVGFETTSAIHPVSITRFPLRRFSPGAGLLINRFFHR